MSETIQKIALGIVRDGDAVLMIERRKKERGENNELLQWVFPGGKMEPGETPSVTAEREVYEETGRHVHALSTIDEGEHPSFPVRVHYVACELTNRRAENTTDFGIVQAKWIPIAKLGMFVTSTLNEKVEGYLLT